MIRDEATERQVRAARPNVSTWLAANAGSGKTRVLTDRVARLLLDGVRPENILCLTYTKAAAAEMQNRLFDRLGKWAMMNRHDLEGELRLLGAEQSLTKGDLARARTLFASAIEAPGGLKIQTIHAFCAGLLRRFPVEAGVSPQFSEMEDRAADLLRDDIIEDMARARPDLVENLARHLTDEDFAAICKDVLGKRGLFRRPVDPAPILAALGLPPDADADFPLSLVFAGGEDDLMARTCALLANASDSYRIVGIELAKHDYTAPNWPAFCALKNAFLYASDHKNGNYAKGDSKSVNWPQSNHRKVVEHMAPVLPELHALMDRTAAGLMAEKSLQTRDRSLALAGFGHEFLTRYETAKADRGWLDFDDLIDRARDLLSDPKVAAWVLYRLDGRIDHVLVDEAQDTSPAQWQVIERLTQEFTSGDGARDVPRTVFVVGDKKQSIYSFQGAAPDEFDRMREDFAARYRAIEQPFERTTLEYSFRSAETILRLVDETFAGHEAAGFAANETHRAFKHRMPGRVDLWPLVEKGPAVDEPAWDDPLDRIADAHPAHLLADMIAARLADMIDHATIPDTGARGETVPMRRVTPGDILILVQRRGPLFHEIIRACKQRGLPLAGADRLKVGAELAVRDLGALLAALATPEDDLSLACALRSPLFGLSENDLFQIANPRKGFLIEALRNAGDRFAEALAIWTDLAGRTDFLRPYDLIERILTRHNGRQRLLARLGEEAEEGIDALLSQALAFERDNIPSLTGFLRWMETDDLEIKRQADGSGGLIRVMTVHGAKGLEAPVVILPDTAKRDTRPRGAVLNVSGAPLWRDRADAATQLQIALTEQEKEAERAERERLLYVAMTRAECWLIVAAAGELGTDGLAWHDRVSKAMLQLNALPRDFGPDLGEGLRLESGDWDAEIVSVTPETTEIRTTPAPLPSGPAPQPDLPAPVLSPSDLGGAKALPGDAGQDEASAKLHGTLVHLALEHLPGLSGAEMAATWPRLAALTDETPDATQLARALAEAQGVLNAPDLAWLFEAGALAEVPITAHLRELDRRIYGVIDRLLVGPDLVRAVDFKTNATIPDRPDAVPSGLLRQMGAYAAALGQVYPDHRIETSILWTAAPRLMSLPHDLVMTALSDTTLP